MEVALGVLILGVSLSLCLPLLKAQKRKFQEQKSQQIKESVTHSLVGYLMKNRKLPCPAIDHQGVAENTCLQQYIGILPYKTLGLPAEFARTADGKWFEYAVDPNLCKEKKAVNTGSINLWDPEEVFCTTTGNNNLLSKNLSNDFVAFFLRTTDVFFITRNNLMSIYAKQPCN